MKDDNFDLILSIPCAYKNEKKFNCKDNSDIPVVLKTLPEIFNNKVLEYHKNELEIKNANDDNKSNLIKYANIFCEQIKEHSQYELIFNDESSNITTDRYPLTFGQVIIYEDEKNKKFVPDCCYNFFAVLSKLSVKKSSSNNIFNIKNSSFDGHSFYNVYFVVPDINYHDLTLLMDQSHELWCNIDGNIDSQIVFLDYLNDTFGYKYFGKIYHIIFSDSNQFEALKDDKYKLFNILASEEYKNKDEYSHQIELSESTDEYSYSLMGNKKDFSLTKKEKFYDDYNMYSSYSAYASIFSYYYIINEEDKDLFYKRISPDINNGNFSSEGNILFVLETEIFKITACLVSSMEINEQINNPDMVEIQTMFKNFINTRPLFEKLNYRYLGAQMEADFIFKQFRISEMLDDYDHKRELLKNYCEVTTSILLNRNSKILNWIGIIFALIAGWDQLVIISKKIFEGQSITWSNEFIIPIIVCLCIIVILIKDVQPIKFIKRYFKIC